MNPMHFHRALWLLLGSTLLIACAAPNAPASSTTPAIPRSSPSPTPPVCRPLPLPPTPLPGQSSLFPAVGPNDWVRGPDDAAATIIIYNDFQCAECNHRLLLSLLKAHPHQVRLVYRHYPQPDRYDKTYLAAQAAEAAGRQGRFWEMHDLLLLRQLEWAGLSPEAFTPWLLRQAEPLGLDLARFEADLHDPDLLAKVQNAEAEARAAGIPVLPLVLINGEIYYGPRDYNAFDQIVRLLALGKRQFSSCPPLVVQAGKRYLATLQTEKGEVVIELYADKTPLTVNSFVFLAQRGWYDGVTFHRVIPGYLVQTGDPSGTGVGGPGYLFRDEFHPLLRFDKPGVVAMANHGPDTNGSQFFITLSPQPSFNDRFTIFGHVLQGMDVLNRLTPRDPSKAAILSEGDRLLHILIEEK